MKRMLVAAALLLAAAAVAGVARPEGAEAQQPTADKPSRTVTVTGSASVKAAPDRAQISFGVESQAETARAAVAVNAAEMRRVIEAIKGAGARDVKTQWVSVSARTVEGGKPAGFVASNSVSATLDIGKAGAIIDVAVAAGANQIYGPSLSVSDTEKHYRQALENAVRQARERAAVLAKAAGADLGAVVSLVEGGGGPVPVMQAAKASADSTPIEPGDVETSATVTVTFALA